MRRRLVPRLSWSSVRRRIGSPDALSWPLFLSFYPVALLFTLYGSGVPTSPENLPKLIAASFVSSSCTIVWFVCAKWFIFGRVLPRPPGFIEGAARPGAVIGVFLCALLVRAAVIDALIVGWGLADTSRFGTRLLGSIPSNGVLLVALGLLVPLIREYGNDVVRLERVQAEFLELEATAEARLEQERRDVIELARVGLDERLRTIAGEEPPETLARVRGAIEDLVRPLSHELSLVRPDDGGASAQLAGEAPGFVTVFRSIVDQNPFRPVLSSVWVSLTTLATAPLVWNGDDGPLFAAVVFVVVLGICALSSALWEPILARLGRGARAIVYTMITLIIGLLIGWLGYRLNPDMTRYWVALEATIAAAAVVIGWLFAAIFTLFRHAACLRAKLEGAEAALHARQVSLNAVRRSERRALARILHGPVQDALTAASFRLNEVVSTIPGHEIQGLLPEVRRSLSNALAEMTEVDRAAIPAEDALDQLAELWSGVAEVTWRFHDGAAIELAAHTATRSGFNEIVREAVSNAVRHGGADVVRIAIRHEDGLHLSPTNGENLGQLRRNESRLRVEITSTGVSPAPDAVAGFGTMLFDELTLSWSREALNPGTRIVAILPLVP